MPAACGACSRTHFVEEALQVIPGPEPKAEYTGSGYKRWAHEVLGVEVGGATEVAEPEEREVRREVRRAIFIPSSTRMAWSQRRRQGR